MGDVIDLSLLVERIGRSSLGIVIVFHRDGIERLRARPLGKLGILLNKRRHSQTCLYSLEPC